MSTPRALVLARPARHALGMAVGSYRDVARFRDDDPAELVSAALACPICLRSDGVEWLGCREVYEEAVDCRCPACATRWRVYLQPQQLLRLELWRTAGG